ncbi:hypothetical protein TrVGV298_009164 [Trichoderma virens]|nr:hypothetical protein TrVGV298_009164 [Trichoderma virens]
MGKILGYPSETEQQLHVPFSRPQARARAVPCRHSPFRPLLTHLAEGQEGIRVIQAIFIKSNSSTLGTLYFGVRYKYEWKEKRRQE